MDAREEHDGEDQLVLRGELFWRWRAVSEAVARCDAEIKARTPLIDQLLDQHPELKKLLGERAAYIQQRQTMSGEYKTVLAELETHFGFPMAGVSIDDMTGRVHRLSTNNPSMDVPTKAPTNGVHPAAKVRSSKPPPVAPAVHVAPKKKSKKR